MPSPATPLTKPCWICGAPANTGEHKAMHANLRDVFGSVTQSDPVFFRDKRGQRTVPSLNAKLTKFPDKICLRCNSARTQPHDRAWQRLYRALRARRLRVGGYVRANRIFVYDTARHLLNVHLYFIKQFGALILEGDAPIGVAPFAAAIMKNKAHPHVFLKFARGPTVEGNSLVARSDLRIDARPDGSCAHASWIYNVDGVAVQITFAEGGMQHGFGWWHPSLGTSRLLIADLQ